MSTCRWPGGLVTAVHELKQVFAFCSDHRCLGVPLDLPIRWLLIGGLYLVFRARGRWGWGLAVSLGLLFSKELFDIIAVQDLTHPKPPDLGDLADLASGLLGILCGELLIRGARRRRLAVRP